MIRRPFGPASEQALLLLSRRPGTHDYTAGKNEWRVEDALSILCRVFPDFVSTIRGMHVLDYGSGTGYQVAALAKNGASYVAGIDTNPKCLLAARELVRNLNLQDQVEFFDSFDARLKGRFDIVIAQNSMEHFPDPALRLQEMAAALRPNGRVFVTFGPPWFAPYGSHMFFFTKLPWVNIVFDETTVLNVRRHFRHDGAKRYEDVESGLNRMTVRKFERLLADANVRVLFKKYECVKNIDFLGSIPVIRELFVNHISIIFTKI